MMIARGARSLGTTNDVGLDLGNRRAEDKNSRINYQLGGSESGGEVHG